MAAIPLEALSVSSSCVAHDVVSFGCQLALDDSSVRRGGVFDLAFAVHEDGVVRDRAVRPFVVEFAPVQIAIDTSGQQGLPVGVQLKTVVRVVPVALGPERLDLKRKCVVALSKSVVWRLATPIPSKILDCGRSVGALATGSDERLAW